VHLIDQARSKTKDFSCSKDRVLKRMRYFTNFFNDKVNI